MEENENHTMLEFEAPKELPTFIKVIGVGGGGGNAVNHMFRQGIQGVDFIVCNTDSQALQSSPVPKKIALGKGLGAGSKPERAKEAVLEKADEIKEVLSHNTQMLFITAGMGGGTGTGAAPVIAEIAKSIDLVDADTEKILVVAIVTMPFSFEGRRRREQATKGIEELRKHVDSILVINNDKLRAFGDMTINVAFSKADDVLLTAAKGIAEMITVTSYVNVDFQDVNTVMENSGTALMGTGIGKGENRAMDAIKAASTSVLLNDDNIQGAQNVLLYFSCNPEHMMRMDEIETVTTYLTDLIGPDSDEVIWGMGSTDDLDDEVKITLIATGFEKKNRLDPPISDIPVNVQTTSRPRAIAHEQGATIIHKTQETTETAGGYNTAREPQAANHPQSQPSSHVHTLNEDDDNKYTANDSLNGSQEETKHIETNADGGHTYHLEDYQDAVMTAVEDNQPEEDPYESSGIHVIQQEDQFIDKTVPETPIANVAQQQPTESYQQPTYTSAPSQMEEAGPLMKEKDTISRADRIKRMHELLKNNPDGPAIVSQMRPVYDDTYTACTSGCSESGSTVMDAAGNLIENNSFLFNQPD